MNDPIPATILWIPSLAAGLILLLLLVKKSGLMNTYMYRRRLEEEYADFLSSLLVYEANGMRLDEVLDYAASGDLVLPDAFIPFAKLYSSTARIINDPYTVIRRLAGAVPSRRISEFLKGYSEVLITTNDTRHYVESALRGELQRMNEGVRNTLTYVDSLYEGLMILLLSMIVYSYLPLAGIPPLFAGLSLTIIGVAGYMLVSIVSGRALRPSSMVVEAGTLGIMAAAPLILLGQKLPAITIILAYTTLSALSIPVYRRLGRLDAEADILLEEVYAALSQKMPLDQAFIKASGKLSAPFKTLRNLLLMGYNYEEARRTVRLTPYANRILGLLLAPVKYSASSVGHVGYVLGISGGVRGLRNSLAERSRVYYVYALTLPAVLIVFSRSMRGIGGVGLISTGLVAALSTASIIVSTTLSSKIGYGCGLCSLKNILLITIAYAAALLLA